MVGFLFFFSGNLWAAEAACHDVLPIEYTYKIINHYPHDSGAFTQGLVYSEGYLYESSGLYERSFFKQVELESGKVVKIKHLPATVFAEGLALADDKLVLLSYREGKGFVYDKTTFGLQGEFFYSKEGWGLTFDGKHLVMSNGTAELVWLDLVDKKPVKRLQVLDQNKKIFFLNELEFVEEEIYANIWQTEKIARIDPRTGCVVGWLDLQGLTAYLGPYRNIDVLNGIAYDQKRKRLFVTGKWWSKLFEITLVRKVSGDTILESDKQSTAKSDKIP